MIEDNKKGYKNGKVFGIIYGGLESFLSFVGVFHQAL